MNNVGDEYRSARHLINAIRDLETSIGMPYDPMPENASIELFNAAASVAFFSRCLLSEVVSSEVYDLRGTGAARLAVMLADFNSARSILEAEISDIRENQPQYEEEFRSSLRELVRAQKLGLEWEELING
jgi:hypothetical protein